MCINFPPPKSPALWASSLRAADKSTCIVAYSFFACNFQSSQTGITHKKMLISRFVPPKSAFFRLSNRADTVYALGISDIQLCLVKFIFGKKRWIEWAHSCLSLFIFFLCNLLVREQFIEVVVIA